MNKGNYNYAKVNYSSVNEKTPLNVMCSLENSSVQIYTAIAYTHYPTFYGHLSS